MKQVLLASGTKCIDTVLKFTDPLHGFAWLEALKTAGVECIFRYVTSLDVDEVARILQSGFKLGLVTYAHSWKALEHMKAMQALGIPKGVDLYLDVEDEAKKPVPELISSINAWASIVKSGGYIPGQYVGAGCPLTSKELYALLVSRYWHSCSRVVDRDGNEAAPACGWVLHQLSPPNIELGDCTVDINFAQHDYLGRAVSVVSL